MSSQPHLRVIDAQTGQVEDVCPHCVVKDQAIERLTRSYEGTIQRLRLELEDRKADAAARDPLVVGVVEDWCRTAEASGWWVQRPRPTEPRLEATRKAMNGGAGAGYLMLVNAGGFISAAHERKNPRFQRAWLEPATLYGKFIDSHAQTALDPENDRVRVALSAPRALIDRWGMLVEPLADPCDHCGHIRVDHDKPSIANGFTEGACLVHGCGCSGFDDLHLRLDRWAREQERTR